MKIAYQWLHEYIKTNQTAEELAGRLQLASCEVESVENKGEKLKGLRIGKVEKVTAHPQADRLRIATVKVGRATHQIVCGAANLAEGQTVIVALPGTTLYPLQGAPFTIQKAQLRGIESEGMLCAAAEIGLPLPSQGILVLDDNLVSGTDFAEAVGLADTVLDLEITPNRADLFSYRGIAREVATLEKKSLQELAIASLDEQDSASPLIGVTIEDTRVCHRYSAICLENITVKESPVWLQARLLLSDVRPVNNVVDVMNYVMLELGQPLHAFDLDIVGSKIKVRTAQAKEALLGIDGTERQLEAGDIVIVGKDDQIIALAGIMGGKNSEVSATTQRILVESANFDRAQIRRTSRRIGLRTEASTRFEKGLDPELTVTALKRVVYLLKEINSGGTVSSALLDQYPRNRQERPRIHVGFTRIQQVLGVHISAAEIKSILHHLGFQIPLLTKSSVEAIPPSWRRDISLPEDIIEELIRMWGFERLPLTLPTGEIKAPQPNQFFNDKQMIRRIMASLGLQETISLSFASKQSLQKIKHPLESVVKLENPLSTETEYLIPNHSIHFLENYAAVNLQETDLGLYEIGHVFQPPRQETERLSFVLRNNDEKYNPYRNLRSILKRLMRSLQRLDATYSIQSTGDLPGWLQPGSGLEITYQGKIIGYSGLISPDVVAAFKIRAGRQLLFTTLNLDELLTLPRNHYSYEPTSEFPSSERDITIIVDREMPAQAALDILTQVKNSYRTAFITDIYQGKPLTPDQKSLTIHCVYNNPQQTLTEDEVQSDQKELIKQFRQQLKATITE